MSPLKQFIRHFNNYVAQNYIKFAVYKEREKKFGSERSKQISTQIIHVLSEKEKKIIINKISNANSKHCYQLLYKQYS